MKKITYLIGAFIIVFTACNKDDNIPISVDDVPDVKVSFTTSLVETGQTSDSFLKTAGDYDRPATAPDYISGIEITSDNHDYILVEDIVGTFLFEDQDDNIAEPMEMDIKAGTNAFSAVSTTAVDTFFIGKIQYFSPKLDFDDPNYDELLERAIYYHDEILKESNNASPYHSDTYPLYAKYATETDVVKSISFTTTDNNVHLDLLPQNGRINVIMECSADAGNLGFGVRSTLYDAQDSIVTTIDDYWYHVDPIKYPNGDRFDHPDPIERFGIHSIDSTASVWVFNMDQMVNGTYIKVIVQKRAKSSVTADDWVEILEEDIPVVQGENKTFLIYFDGESAVTGSFSASMSEFTNSYDTREL